MCKSDGCPCKDARIVSARTAEFVRARRADATAVRRDLLPLPAGWPAWPDRIAPERSWVETGERDPETGWPIVTLAGQ